MSTKTDLTAICRSNAPIVNDLAHIVARYGLAIVIGWIGIFKFCSYEALNIEPLVANSPFMGWVYSVFSVGTFSSLLGVVEITTAVLLVLKPWFPRLSLIGSALAIVLFVSTLSFVLTTPGVAEEAAGGFPLLSMTGQFLIKDIVLLGVSILTLGDAMKAIAHRAAPARA
ncbi:hypothetical protein BST28_04205 [Mycolicibacter kumamotonensis]|jgi:uncharacterized membrane protein YkgB|uniref:DUF417 family protein n=1 Tax=Mycolicibacter kumamotonensis TaxID=354243 RepID=A0A1X0EC50_9MYCO|nr:DUF417 family protein [Mycolicibacter kumamotonensis]ORA82202.1 hypothetical protein BST28_04205 [Mycolicibacter kumamotonensis]